MNNNLSKFKELKIKFTNKNDGDIKTKNELKGFQNIARMQQTHSAKVMFAKEPKVYENCDALVTNIPNLALLVLVADCSPILLYEHKNKVIAAIHAGRAGAFLNIIKATVDFMQEKFDSKSENIVASIGASIKKCCYEINDEVLEFSRANFSKFVENRHLDINSILLWQLENLGIRNVENSQICTKCDENFFSYRRNLTQERQAAIIMLRN